MPPLSVACRTCVPTLNSAGKGRLFIEVEAAKNAGLDFLVTVSALGTPHDSVWIRRIEAVAVPAHPSNLACWVAHDQREIWHVLGHNRSGPDERVTTDRDAAHDRGVRADRAAASSSSVVSYKRVPIHLRAGIRNVGQNARRSEEHVVFNHHACIDRHVVLNFDVVSDKRSAIDVHILSDDAPLPDSARLS